LLGDRTRDVRDTIALTKEYIRLCELQMALGMNEAEARKGAAERLTAGEVLGALEGDPPEGG
ncbi:MAG: hypothetical protein CYG60_08520, partial [Actinobacteria bacterium]